MEDKKKILISKTIFSDSFIASNGNEIYFFKRTSLENFEEYTSINISDVLSYELSSQYTLVLDEDASINGFWNVLCYIYMTSYEHDVFIKFCYDIAEHLKK